MELTNEEKKSIILNYIVNANRNQYNLEISLYQESSVNNPDADLIASLQKQIADQISKKDALELKLKELDNG
jgi:hypothetical protein